MSNITTLRVQRREESCVGGERTRINDDANVINDSNASSALILDIYGCPDDWLIFKSGSFTSYVINHVESRPNINPFPHSTSARSPLRFILSTSSSNQH